MQGLDSKVERMNMDQEIIKKYMQNKNCYDINESVVIGEKEYTFVYQEIPQIMLKMMLPKGTIPLSSYSTKVKYPDENRPDIILTTSDDETINFLFNQFKDIITKEELPDISQGIQMVLKRMYPASVFYQDGIAHSELSDIFWFDYSTVALDDNIYNIMYVLCLNNTLMLGGFCCLQRYRKPWKKLVLQILETIAHC